VADVIFGDGGSSMRGTIRVLRIIYGVIGYVDGAFRGEVSFGNLHCLHFGGVVMF
jgi:hypothetical protein